MGIDRQCAGQLDGVGQLQSVAAAQARRAFGTKAFDGASRDVQCVLFSVVYNRGPSMVGKNREYMRTIRDDCEQLTNKSCVAETLRTMARRWTGTPIEQGMYLRRNAEADYAVRNG